MSHVEHNSIGANARKVEITDEAKAERRKEMIDRFNVTPWAPFTLDQLSVWALWATAAVSIFLYCTVSAVVMAVR